MSRFDPLCAEGGIGLVGYRVPDPGWEAGVVVVIGEVEAIRVFNISDLAGEVVVILSLPSEGFDPELIGLGSSKIICVVHHKHI